MKLVKRSVTFILANLLFLSAFLSSSFAQESIQDPSSALSVERAREASQEIASRTVQVYLLRHFEKSSSSTQPKDPELTEKGAARAERLATFLQDKNITHIFSSNYRRTRQTAAPSAEKLGLDVALYDPSKLPAFANQLLALLPEQKGSIVVVGHSNTTGPLLTLLGGPHRTLSEADYGDVFFLDLSDDKQLAAGSFSQTVIE